MLEYVGNFVDVRGIGVKEGVILCFYFKEEIVGWDVRGNLEDVRCNVIMDKVIIIKWFVFDLLWLNYKINI